MDMSQINFLAAHPEIHLMEGEEESRVNMRIPYPFLSKKHPRYLLSITVNLKVS